MDALRGLKYVDWIGKGGEDLQQASTSKRCSALRKSIADAKHIMKLTQLKSFNWRAFIERPSLEFVGGVLVIISGVLINENFHVLGIWLAAIALGLMVAGTTAHPVAKAAGCLLLAVGATVLSAFRVSPPEKANVLPAISVVGNQGNINTGTINGNLVQTVNQTPLRRHLTPEQKAALSRAFAGANESGKLRVTSIMGDAESAAFAKEISDCAGLPGAGAAAFIGTTEGLQLRIKDRYHEPPLANGIRRACEATRLPITGMLDSDVGIDDVEIVVGSAPEKP